MRRRDLLTSAALGTALALLPAPLRRALTFAADGCVEDQAKLVRRALERGKETGKPVVVFVVPTDEGVRSAHAMLLGTLIDLGSDHALAVLALTEVVCAPLAAVRCLVAHAPDETRDPPLMLVVDSGAAATSVAAVAAPAWDTSALCPPNLDPVVQAACLRRDTRALCARMVTPLRQIVVGRGFSRRARRSAEGLDPATATRVRAAAADGGASLPLALVDAAAPFLLASALATRDGEARRNVIARLAAAGRQRLQEQPPPGARWARFNGCTQYAHNGSDDLVDLMACGLGGVPFMAARFLHFYTAPDRRS